jgi:iron donor protein CyaY
MTIPDSTFNAFADLTLNRLADALEVADEDGLLDVELTGGILTIEFPSGKQFVINKHGPSQQIWLSSPFSGGLHFDYDEASQGWALKDGRRLDTLLKAEVEILLSEEITEE